MAKDDRSGTYDDYESSSLRDTSDDEEAKGDGGGGGGEDVHEKASEEVKMFVCRNELLLNLIDW